ncbi:MAG: L,D-transpeptidase [Acidimicrobiia bacterium]
MSRSQRLLILAATIVAVLLVPTVATAAQPELPPGGTFVDDDEIAQEGWIEAITALRITYGCNPPENDEYCPDRLLTRAEMATLVVRALGMQPVDAGPFTDLAESPHIRDINALAAEGITKGCNPPANDHYCPERSVSRQETAAFLVRAFELDPSDVDHFSDDEDSIFQDEINALAQAGVTVGCGPTSFCGSEKLTRADMAVFIGKILRLTPNVPPERPPPPYPDVGKGRRIIYSNSQQRVWMIDGNEQLVDTYPVSGRIGIPHNGTYRVYSKSRNAWAPYGGITMKNMVRFVRPNTWGNQWAYGFHSIPRYPNGQPMQTEDELGTFRSGGCVRQADHKAAAMYDWAAIGTTVHAIP